MEPSPTPLAARPNINWWTRIDDDVLRAEAALGSTTRKIGILLNRTRNSVIGRARRLGVKLHARAEDYWREHGRKPRLSRPQLRQAKRAKNFAAFGYFKDDLEW